MMVLLDRNEKVLCHPVNGRGRDLGRVKVVCEEAGGWARDEVEVDDHHHYCYLVKDDEREEV
jgi:hypothetical protein